MLLGSKLAQQRGFLIFAYIYLGKSLNRIFKLNLLAQSFIWDVAMSSSPLLRFFDTIIKRIKEAFQEEFIVLGMCDIVTYDFTFLS